MNQTCSTCKYSKSEDNFSVFKNNLRKSCNTCINNKKIYRDSLKCEHKLNKKLCRQCDGSHLCIHDRYKFHCVECSGSGICNHNKRRERCHLCNGNQICQHDKVIDHCKICNLKGWLRGVVTGRMHRVLGYSDFDYLCCTIEEYIEYLEDQFTEEMNWSNHSIVWCIDHILPIGRKDIPIDERINRLVYTNT
jgi:hypothetical protein